MDSDLLPIVETTDDVVATFFPDKIMFLPEKEFYDYVKKEYDNFPYYIKSILVDLYYWERNNKITVVDQFGIKTLVRALYIYSAIDANIRVHNEIMFGISYDSDRREIFRKNVLENE